MKKKIEKRRCRNRSNRRINARDHISFHAEKEATELWIYLLQAFREAANNVLTTFMEQIPLFAVSCLIMIPSFIYRVIGKSKGLHTLVSCYVCCGVNAIICLTLLFLTMFSGNYLGVHRPLDVPAGFLLPVPHWTLFRALIICTSEGHDIPSEVLFSMLAVYGL